MKWIADSLGWFWGQLKGGQARADAMRATARDDARADFEAVTEQWKNLVGAVETRMDKMAGLLNSVEERLAVCETDRSSLRGHLTQVTSRLAKMERVMRKPRTKATSKTK